MEKLLRCDVARGLVRMSNEAVLFDPKRDAPPFVIAFEVLEPTTIPRLLIDAVWVLTNIKSITEKGEGGAFMTGVEGFEVSFDSKGSRKSIIRRVLEDGSKEQMSELNLQIRVYEASALARKRRKPGGDRRAHVDEEAGGAGDERADDDEDDEDDEDEDDDDGPRRIQERFLLLVAQSPLPFSLRRAAYTTTRSVGRLQTADSKGADDRRKIWAQLAMHVRGALQPTIKGGRLMEMFESSMDWMRNGEVDGFTCLFSMQRAMDWIKARFLAKHQRTHVFLSPLRVHGSATRMSLVDGGAGEDFLLGPLFRDECRRYDEDVDREVERTYAPGGNNQPYGPGNGGYNGAGRGGGGRKRGRGAAGGRGRGGRGRVMQDDDDDDDDGGARPHPRRFAEDDDSAGVDYIPYLATVRPYAGVLLEEDRGTAAAPAASSGAARGGGDAMEEDDDDDRRDSLPSANSLHRDGGAGERQTHKKRKRPGASGVAEEGVRDADSGTDDGTRSPSCSPSHRDLGSSPDDHDDEIEGGGGGGGGGARRGLPACVAAMSVMVRTAVETTAARLTEFRQHMRTFPESVMLELLRVQMRLPETLLGHMREQMREATLQITPCEMRDIVMGDEEYNMGRPRLAWGDAAWGRQMMTTMCKLPTAHARLRSLSEFMQMAFGLSYTRARGSDSYHNGRVAAYGRFMTFENGAVSRRECHDMYVDMRLRNGTQVEGAAMTRALRYALDVFLACDRCKWNMRPDNLHLLLQLLVSDMMLCLNFYGSVIDGASNGIGATLVVRDGGGSFRRWFKDANSGTLMLGQLMHKGNSSGADHCVGAYKQAVAIGDYDERFRMSREFITEIKRVTEVGLIQETCNTFEWRGNTPTLTHLIVETDDRKYTTELKAGGDQQSLNNLQAITWLIPRNTVAMDTNKYATTRGDADTNERIRVEHRQAKDGYWILCSNCVREGARERMHTVLAVSRSIISSAAGVEMDQVLRRGEKDEVFLTGLRSDAKHSAKNGRVDRATLAGQDARLMAELARPVFFLGMGTAVFAGFVQWTGMLERVRETRISAALLQTFYAQLDLCQDLLNPDMATGGDKIRFFQVSKARGVGMALFAMGMRETLDVGRRLMTQQTAVEQAALSLKLEGVAPLLVPWVMADTLEHMFRLDFMLLMVLIGRLLRVPCVPLRSLLAWLQEKEDDRVSESTCPQAEAFYRAHCCHGHPSRSSGASDDVGGERAVDAEGDGGGEIDDGEVQPTPPIAAAALPPPAAKRRSRAGGSSRRGGVGASGAAEEGGGGVTFVQEDSMMLMDDDGDGRGLLPIRHCLYLTHPLLRVGLKLNAHTPEARNVFNRTLGARLRREFSETLWCHCRVEDNEEGDEVVHAMLETCVNKPFAWPSVLGNAETLHDFWKGRAPPMPAAATLRNNPSLLAQLERLTLPPLRMIPVENTVAQLGVDLRWLLLMTSLSGGHLAQAGRFSAVSQWVQRFYRHCVPPHMVGARELFTGLPSPITGTGFLWPRVLASPRRLLRRPARDVGMDAPCPSGMIEDMGVAAPRYELAHMLGVDEKDLPTECIHYELPHDIWMPALLGEGHDVVGAVRWSNGRIRIWGEGMSESLDVTLEVRQEPGLSAAAAAAAGGDGGRPPPSHEEEEEEEEADHGGGYLGGRSRVPIRPTCAFYRPGIAVSLVVQSTDGDQRERRHVLGVVGAFNPSSGRYRVWLRRPPPRPGAEGGRSTDDDDGGDDDGLASVPPVWLTPYEIEERMVKPDARLLVKVRNVVTSDGELVQLENARGLRITLRDNKQDQRELDAEETQFLLCTIDYQGAEDVPLPAGCIGVRMPRIAAVASSAHASQQREREAPPLVSSVAEDEDDDGGLMLHGASHGAHVQNESEEKYAPRLIASVRGTCLVVVPPSSSPSSSSSSSSDDASSGAEEKEAGRQRRANARQKEARRNEEGHEDGDDGDELEREPHHPRASGEAAAGGSGRRRRRARRKKRRTGAGGEGLVSERAISSHVFVSARVLHHAPSASQR